MTKKDIFKNDILMAMKHHLKADQMAILENVLSEALYRVDIVEMECLPAERFQRSRSTRSTGRKAG